MPVSKRAYAAAMRGQSTTRSGKRYAAKRRNTRRTGYRRLGRPSRGLSQSRYMFKRTTSEVVELDASPGAGFSVSDKGVYKHWVFSLNDAGLNVTNMTGMFRRYRINAVSLKMYFSQTQVAPVNTVTSIPNGSSASNILTNPNSQVLVYTTANRTGESTAPTEESILNRQAKQVRTAINGGRPITVYMKLNQLSEVYNSSVNTDYTTVRPQFIGTGETGAPHYGMTMFIKRADGDDFTSGMNNRQKVNIQATYYLEFAGAQ